MLPLFARNNGPRDEELLILGVTTCAVLVVVLFVSILFLLTLHRALDRCAPHNRTMGPGLVWLNLVPLLSIAWQFITVIRVAESLQNEFRDRGRRRRDDYGKSLGIVMCSMNVAGWIPYCGCLFLLAWFVCGIVYWVKIAGYSRELAGMSYEDYDYDDRDDDRYDDRDDDRYDDDDDRDRRSWDRGRR
jgi:hypothetical protein